MHQESSLTLEDALLELKEPRDRFLARVLSRALGGSWRISEDFFEYFSPRDIVRALDDEPELRTRLLVETVGLHPKIAQLKSAQAASDDLQLAVDAGIADARTVLRLLPLAVRVQRLDAGRLWHFAVDGDWLDRAGEDGDQRHRAEDRVHFIIDTALSEGLITFRKIAEGLGSEDLATRIPAEHLRKAIVYALDCARNEELIDEARLLQSVDVPTLVDAIPLPDLWERVVLAQIAAPQGLLDDAPQVTDHTVPDAREMGIRPPSNPPQSPESSQPPDEPADSDAVIAEKPSSSAPSVPDVDEAPAPSSSSAPALPVEGFADPPSPEDEAVDELMGSVPPPSARSVSEPSAVPPPVDEEPSERSVPPAPPPVQSAPPPPVQSAPPFQSAPPPPVQSSPPVPSAPPPPVPSAPAPRSPQHATQPMSAPPPAALPPPPTALPAPPGRSFRDAPDPVTARRHSAPPPGAGPSRPPTPPRGALPPVKTVPIGLSNPLPPPPAPQRGTEGTHQRVPARRGSIPSLTDDAALELSDSEIDVSGDNDTTVRTTPHRPGNPPHAAFPLQARSPSPSSPNLRPKNEAERRRDVTARLTAIGRLPANNEYLSLAILRAIVTMYDEIKTRRGNAARAQCVRECFDNESHLRAGMLALLDLLNPGLSRENPTLLDADNDSLIDAVLSQERALWENARRGSNQESLPKRRAVHVAPVRPPRSIH